MMTNEEEKMLEEIVRNFAFYLAGMFDTVSYNAEITIPSSLSRGVDERKMTITIDLRMK